ncbi:MAG: hypothetical protein PHD55_09560 [Methanoregula sp.]|nr:hypothetical protein [Methanoregula sp.]
MDRAAVLAAAQRIGVALAACIIPSIVLPLGAAILLGLPLAPVYGLIASAFLIEYGAIPIGIGLGLPAVYVFCAATAVEAGIFLGIYGVLDVIGHTSNRVAGLLERVHAVATRSRMFDRYGILGLFPCEILVGVYICAPVSWLFGWNEVRSFAITMAGYIVAALVTTLATLGVIRLLFS